MRELLRGLRLSQSEYFELNLRFQLTILVTDYQILIEHVLRRNSHPVELEIFANIEFPKNYSI